MSDRMWAMIWVWGRLPVSLLDDFCEAALDIDPDAVRHASDEGLPLELEDEEAPWGEFDELERFCREHGLGYLRHSDAKYEHDACMQWRPSGGGGAVTDRLMAMGGGDDLVRGPQVRDILERAHKIGAGRALREIAELCVEPPKPGALEIVGAEASEG